MLAALLAGYLFLSLGGGLAVEMFSKDKQALIGEVVADPARADAAVDTIKRGRNDVEASAKRFRKIAQEFGKTDKVQSAGLDELTPFLRQATEQRRIAQEASLDRIFELRKTLTEGEWNAVFAKLQ